jgi:hypothetical protein
MDGGFMYEAMRFAYRLRRRAAVGRSSIVPSLPTENSVPFKVIEARPETSNYQLELLPVAEYSSVYPAKMLLKYVRNNSELSPSREPTRPPPIIPEDNRWEVEEIRDFKDGNVNFTLG